MKSLIALLIITMLLTGCSPQTDQAAKTDEAAVPASSKVTNHSSVIARVNGSPITQAELDDTVLRLLGEEQVKHIDKESKQKILESLVASRAISQAAKQEYPSEIHGKITRESKAFEEQLWVKHYLSQHTVPQPVTEEMVKNYYESHPERFGGKTLKKVEIIVGTETKNTNQRADLIALLNKADTEKDWQAYAETLKKKGYSVQYRKSNVTKGIVNEKLVALANSLKDGDVSSVTYIEKKPYKLRLLATEQKPPRPLSEVRSEIRKSLLPQQLSKAIKGVKQKLLTEANVEYVN